MSPRTLIIAEAGVNHNGDLVLAKRLVEEAAKAGADLVKFQSFSASRLVTSTAVKADYQSDNTHKDITQHEMLKQLELNEEAHEILLNYCHLKNIGFFSTAFDIESIELLSRLGQSYFKIPSGEITNLSYLRQIGRKGKEVILSTGMATLGEIEGAINILEKEGTFRSKITILHCTTEYPTPMNEVNLRAMLTIQTSFGTKVGYSDHTQGIEVATAAVAMGASVIEKHFTLDRNLPGPDHKASLEPHELTAMVKAIRNIEIALGDGIKRVTKSELRNLPNIRRSLVALRRISKGETFTSENIGAKRPGNGISPMYLENVLGRTASRDFSLDELIEL